MVWVPRREAGGTKESSVCLRTGALSLHSWLKFQFLQLGCSGAGLSLSEAAGRNVLLTQSGDILPTPSRCVLWGVKLIRDDAEEGFTPLLLS